MFRRLRQWWTLENWNRAGDLAAKLVTIVAAFTAINFFSARPNLTIYSINCRTPIDGQLLEQLYRSKNLPSKVLSTVMSNKELREPTFETFYQHFPNATFRYSCGSDGWPLTPPYTTGIRNFEEKRAIALDIYPEVKQRLPKVPGIALDLMKNIASPKEFKLALEQVENARHAELLVIIQNTGWGTARNVRLLPPRGFKMENPADYKRHAIIPGQTEISEADLVYPEDPMIDLGARKSALYAFITAPGDSAIQLNDRSSLLPAAEIGAVINLPVVVGVTVILFVGLWLPAIIKDIRQFNPPDRSNP